MLHAFLCRILDVRNTVEFDILQLIADLFDAADIDGLDDSAPVRIYADRAARGKRLAARRRLRAAGDPDIDRVGVRILCRLDEGREVRVRDREPHRADDLAAAFLKAGLEPRFGVDAGAVIGDHRIDGFDAV